MSFTYVIQCQTKNSYITMNINTVLTHKPTVEKYDFINYFIKILKYFNLMDLTNCEALKSMSM